MQNRCRFGVELPYNVADVFLNEPERFFSLRLMPPDSAIPQSPHGPDLMAKRLKELGADFVVYDLRPHDLAASINAARWARANGLALMLNNPACQINADPTPGFHTWVYPPDLLEQVKEQVDLLGVIYDELIHHKVHPGMTGHTNPWNALADVTKCVDTGEAYLLVEGGLADLFAHTAGTHIPAFTEQVIPALYHAVARSGGNPGCKVLKEQITPVSLSLCMSAAHQYHTKWLATVDLWEGDSGPWYQIMGRHSGHSPSEFLNALKLMALLNPFAALSESADILWVADSVNAEMTEFGETFRYFRQELLPSIQPAFDVHTWQPTVAFVHCEDGGFRGPKRELEFDEAPPIYEEPPVGLLGAPNLPYNVVSAKWLRAWHHLTWGKCSGYSLHNYFNPLESAVARQFEVGGDEHDFIHLPTIKERRDPKRVETHLHNLFTPLNNVAVFDGYVKPEQLEGVALIVLCGSYCWPETQAAVRKAVEAGARCLCQEECAPQDLRASKGQKLGNGHWWTVSDFDQPAAFEQFLRFRGYPNQWILKSQLGLVRIYSTDPWGNEINWEVD